MAKGDPLTPYQKGVVRRYYEHQDAMVHQQLSELVSEIYLCEDDKAAARLWKTVEGALRKTNAGAARIDAIVRERDVKALAELVSKLF